MAEEGIDITAEKPKILTTDAVEASDVVITAGCGDTCPHLLSRSCSVKIPSLVENS